MAWGLGEPRRKAAFADFGGVLECQPARCLRGRYGQRVVAPVVGGVELGRLGKPGRHPGEEYLRPSLTPTSLGPPEPVQRLLT